MERATEHVATPATLGFDNRGAMPAHVQEGAEATVAITCTKDWFAKVLACEEYARRGKLS